MAKHYIRDANFPQGAIAAYYHNAELALAVAEYHLLRCGGAEWMWECDGEVGPVGSNPNHVPDGDMAAVGVGNYTSVGVPAADLSKDATEKFSGLQSLKIVSKSVGSGARTSVAGLTSMTNAISQTHSMAHSLSGPVNGIMTLTQNSINYPFDASGGNVAITGCTVPGNNGSFYIKRRISNQSIEFFNPSGGAEVLSALVSSNIQRKYEIAIWAKNASGVAWDVQVDRGLGSYTTLGTIPSDGVWKMYPFTFLRASTGNVFVQILDPSWSTDHTIYVNGINVFRSFFEYWPHNVYGADGGVSGVDTFDTGTYVPTGYDTGKYLIFWDDDFPDNTGCYKILGVSGGDYQLDLRSGSMTLTTHMSGDIPWRIVDLDNQQFFNIGLAELGTAAWAGMGFGLESPHVSKWRFFYRLNTSAGLEARERPFSIWASPVDTDFNLSTGFFYNTGPSTLRKTGVSSFVRMGPNQYFVGGTSGNGANTNPSCRLFVMTDDDISFLTHVNFSTLVAYQSTIFVGYTGADPDHPGVEEFLLMAPFGTPDTGTQNIGFDDGTDNAGYSMATFTPEEYGATAVLGALGYGAATAGVITQTNAAINQWSSEEHIDPILIIRDPYGSEGCGSERELTKGLYMGRTNMTQFATFDSGNYLHFVVGLVWEWNGATLVP